MASDLEKSVWHFVRNEYEDKYHVDVPLSLKYLTLQFSKRIVGCPMLTIKEDLEFYALLSSQLGNCRMKSKEFNLLFRASEHEFKVSEFQKFCDGHGPTMTIVRNELGHIFGGFTNCKWTSNSSVWTGYDSDAFLFLIRSKNPQQECPKAFVLEDSYNKAIVLGPNFGPCFGDGDIFILGRFCSTEISSYDHANEFSWGHPCGNSGGVNSSKIVEYELYKMV